MDQATQEPPGLGGRNLLLPRCQLDRSKVLHTGTVLREQARPVLPVRVDLDAAGPGDNTGSRPVGAAHFTDDLLALPDYVGVPLVEGDAQLEDRPPALGQAAVAEVHAEQIGVPGWRDRQARTPRA